MDSVLKNVQCDYIPLFGNIVQNLFPATFMRADEKQKKILLKMFKTWSLLIDAGILNDLDHNLNLDRYVSVKYLTTKEKELFTDEDRRKLVGYFQNFEAVAIPDRCRA